MPVSRDTLDKLAQFDTPTICNVIELFDVRPRDHVFTTIQCTPLTHGSGLYHVFVRHCKLVGIETRRLDAEGREIDHVDPHSLRRDLRQRT